MQRFNSYILRYSNDLSFAFCPKCKKDQPIEQYYKHSVRSDGAVRYRPYCKSCRQKGPRTHWARPVHTTILINQKQTCKTCKKEKPLEFFYANGCFSDGVKKYRSSCKECVLLKAKASNFIQYKTKAERRSSSPKNFISGILNHAAKRKKHLGFNIDLVYLLELYEKQQGLCALSGVEMTYLAGKGRVNTNISIDRIDSAVGYVRGNVQFVCDVVNRMKQDLPQSEMFIWCRRVLSTAGQ